MVLMAACWELSACGMKGELYLPDEKTENAPAK
jgi:predicted small lipoprotein YifL